jgi:hypothetical protein
VAAVVLVGGCGDDRPRQDADEPSAMFAVEVEEASFPARQRLADATELRVTVRNSGPRTIPDVAVTLTSDDAKGGAGFSTRAEQPGLADPTQNLWIVDAPPRGAQTALVSTWALGPLRAGRTASFVWRVTPVVAGSHVVRYRIGAGLDGRAVAQTAGGDEPGGVFRVTVARRAPTARVDGDTGRVITRR